ncbi:MAG: DUF1634 domain-containing protein [Methanomassiliicoccales archaeon]|nr:DUF1634 domain-containing protein [Methanomassiliicoccales archaeon]
MWTSVILLIAGLAWFALAPSGTQVALGPVQAIDAMLRGDPVGLISLGILFLIATPLLRIITALAVFAQTREWKFVLVSTLVLLIIAVAIFVKG